MNRGAQLLATKIARGEQHKLADELGIEQSYLSRIVRGERVPGLTARKAMLEKLSIPLLAWDEPPSEDTLPDPIPPERDVAQTGRGFADGTRTKPAFVGEDADSNPSGPSNPEAGNAA